MLTQGAGCREKQLRLYHPRPVSTHPRSITPGPPSLFLSLHLADHLLRPWSEHIVNKPQHYCLSRTCCMLGMCP